MVIRDISVEPKYPADKRRMGCCGARSALTGVAVEVKTRRDMTWLRYGPASGPRPSPAPALRPSGFCSLLPQPRQRAMRHKAAIQTERRTRERRYRRTAGHVSLSRIANLSWSLPSSECPAAQSMRCGKRSSNLPTCTVRAVVQLNLVA